MGLILQRNEIEEGELCLGGRISLGVGVGGRGVYTKLYWARLFESRLTQIPPLKINQGFDLAYFKCFQ